MSPKIFLARSQRQAGARLPFGHEEIRDSGENFFFENLPQGEDTFTYRIRTAMSGAFQGPPATLQSMNAPEFNACSAGDRIVIQ